MPARLEPDGRLRVQLKPGNWTISLTARQRGPVETLARAEVAALWPQQEIWSFQAQNALRVVQLSGAPALDPAQTNVPAEWRPWPAYLLQPGEALRFVTRTRGDTEPDHVLINVHCYPIAAYAKRRLYLNAQGVVLSSGLIFC